MQFQASILLVVVALAAIACDSTVEDDGEGGGDGATTTSSSTTTTTATTSSTASTTQSTGPSMFSPCGEPTIVIEYTSGDHGPTESCKSVDTLEPTSYTVTGDAGAYRAMFEALVAHESVNARVVFHTSLNSSAGYRFAGGGVSVEVGSWSQCDQNAMQTKESHAMATNDAFLATCAAEVGVPGQIACIRGAFEPILGDPSCVFFGQP